MKILKYVGIVILVLLVLVFAGTLFLPSESHVERSITINAKPAAIYPEISDFKNFNSWSPWHAIDPDTEYSYEGGTSGEGAKMSWVSENKDVGKGSQWIVETVKNQSVKTNLVFEGFEDPSEANFVLEPDGDQTKVTWTFDSNLSGLYKYFGVAMDGMLGPFYETGLQNLKSVVEAKPTYSVDIGLEEVEAIPYLGISETLAPEELDQISEKMGSLFGELVSYITENSLEMAGMPMTVYPNWGGDSYEMECAIPVTEGALGDDQRIMLKSTAAGMAVKAVHMGDYHKLDVTHAEVDRYVTDHNLTATGAPFEVYVTDPGNEPDTSKWVTHIYYPVVE